MSMIVFNNKFLNVEKQNLDDSTSALKPEDKVKISINEESTIMKDVNQVAEDKFIKSLNINRSRTISSFHF